MNHIADSKLLFELPFEGLSIEEVTNEVGGEPELKNESRVGFICRLNGGG